MYDYIGLVRLFIVNKARNGNDRETLWSGERLKPYARRRGKGEILKLTTRDVG